MPEEHTQETMDVSRRNFLGEVTVAVAGVGLAASCIPFIESMSPSTDILAAATTEVDLETIALGKVETVPWEGKPIFVMHRTEEQISKMKASMGGFDPEADAKRVKRPQWLVVIGICTHLGCVPNKVAEGWLCPCHGSLYDNSGRVLRGPAPKNLYLPPYHFISDDALLVGETEKKKA